MNISTQNILEMIKNKKKSFQNGETSSKFVEIDESFVTPPVSVPDTIEKENLILIRSTEFLPQNRKILSPVNASAQNKDSNITVNNEQLSSQIYNRHTIHCAFNGLVRGGFFGASHWEENPFIIIEPFKYHNDSTFRGGFVGDSFFDQNISLSNEAIIMVQKDYYEAHKDQFNDEYNYLIYSGDPEKCVQNVIQSMGYTAISHAKDPSGYLFENKEKDFQNKFVDYLNRHNGKDLSNLEINAIHSGTIYAEYEREANHKEALLEYLRNKKVDVSKNFEISRDEFLMFFLGRTGKNKFINQYDTKNGKTNYDEEKRIFIDDFSHYFENGIQNYVCKILSEYGLQYDKNANKFYSVGYEDYIKRSKSLTSDSLEVAAVTNILKTELAKEKARISANQESRSTHSEVLESAKEIIKNKVSLTQAAEIIGLDITNTQNINFSDLIELSLISNVNINSLISKYGFKFDEKSIVSIGINDFENLKNYILTPTKEKLKAVSMIDETLEQAESVEINQVANNPSLLKDVFIIKVANKYMPFNAEEAKTLFSMFDEKTKTELQSVFANVSDEKILERVSSIQERKR